MLRFVPVLRLTWLIWKLPAQLREHPAGAEPSGDTFATTPPGLGSAAANAANASTASEECILKLVKKVWFLWMMYNESDASLSECVDQLLRKRKGVYDCEGRSEVMQDL